MDFRVTIGDEQLTTVSIHEVRHFMDHHLAQWNNFGGGELNIKVDKVENDTQTIGIEVQDGIFTQDIGPR